MARRRHLTLDLTGLRRRLPAYRRRVLQRTIRTWTADPTLAGRAREVVSRAQHFPAIDRRRLEPLAAVAESASDDWLAGALEFAEDVVGALLSQIGMALSDALDAVCAPLARGRGLLQETLDLCAGIVPPEHWLPLFACDAGRADTPDRAGSDCDDGLARQLQERGFGKRSGPLGRHAALGVWRLALPPHPAVFAQLRDVPGLAALADGQMPVGRVPLRRGSRRQSADAPDVAALLGVPDGARQALGSDVRLCVLDTGIDAAHPAFAGRITERNYRVFSGSSRDDRVGHGTHVSGIAAGLPRADGAFGGVAPSVQLSVGRVFDDDGLADVEAVVEGLTWAHEQVQADVISLSLGATGYAPGESVLSRMCERLAAHGTLVVAAAGNDGPGADTIDAPGDAPSVLTVGAIDREYRVARFSSRGAKRSGRPLSGKPECVAPGLRIVSARSSASRLPGIAGDDSYTVMDGTSMATPAVAGAAALVLSAARQRDAEVPPLVAGDALVASCRPLAGYEAWEAGAGVPDVARALALVREPTATAPAPPGDEIPRRDRKAATPAQVVHALSAAPAAGLHGAATMPDSATASKAPAYPAAPGGATAPGVSLTRDEARKLELEFINGFEARFYTLAAIPHPVEGCVYDVNPAGELIESFSDREALRALLREASPTAGDLRDYPANKHVEITLVRKRRMFGPKERKIVVAGASLTPLAELVTAGRATTPAGRSAINEQLTRIIRAADPYYYVGLFSTTGWTHRALATIPQGTNFQVFLLDCDADRGFRVYAPAGFEPALRSAFDPEDESVKRRRVLECLGAAPQLGHAGGLLLIAEVAERCNVSEPLAAAVAREFSRRDPALEFANLNGTIYLRRRRF